MCLLEEFCCAVSSLCKNCVLTDFETNRDVSLNLSFTAKLLNLKWKCRHSIWAVMTGVRFMTFFFNIGLKIGHCAQYVRKCLRFVSLFTACLVWELSVIPAHYCSVLRLFGYVLPFSLSFPSDSFPTIFPTIIVHEFHIFAMRAICPAHRIRVPLYCPRTQDVQPVSPPLEIRSAVWRSVTS